MENIDQPKPQTQTQASASTQAHVYPFEFTGTGREYFKIWIVNVALTLVTLGIYSAWAKVRTNRYFYANFLLDGEGFEYLAEPLQILKGRVIALVALVGYYVMVGLSPLYGGIALAILLCVFPAAIVLSLRFTRRVSSYRNIRFGFQGTFGEAYKAFLMWPILSFLSLGLLYPQAQVKMSRFVINNSGYGTQNFNFAGTYTDYGKLLLMAIGAFTVTTLIVYMPFILLMITRLGTDSEVPPEALGGLASLALVVPIYGLMFVFAALYMNLKYQLTTLRDHGFETRITGFGFAWVWISNIVLVVLTLGLFLPFAKVRLTRYLASHLSFAAKGSLSDFAAGEHASVSALGQEFGNAFDFDIGLGV